MGMLFRVPQRPIVPILPGGTNLPECLQIFRENQIPYFSAGEQGIRALKAFQDYAEFLTRSDAERRAIRGAGGAPTGGRARERLDAWRREGKRVMTLLAAADLLASYGFKLPPGGLVRSAAEAGRWRSRSGCRSP